jgi:hypothetical protein
MKLQFYKLRLRKWLINYLFNDEEKALIYESLCESQHKKRISMGETLIEQSKIIQKIAFDFVTKLNLYK